MIEPKIFYRKLDSLLAQIRQVKSDANFFHSILKLMMETFSEQISISGGHIFERRGNDFVLIESILNDHSKYQIVEVIPQESEVIKRIFQHGSYIFNLPADQDVLKPYAFTRQITPAGIRVQRTEKQWIILFELRDGTGREEILLFLNSLRTALSYRLFTEAMQSDINMAVQIQSSLLPRSAPKMPGFDIAQFSQPAESVGGDFYDYFQLDENSLGVSLGDASGHGLPAALLVRDVVIGLRMGLNPNTRLVHTLHKLNQVIQRSTYSTNFVSMFIGEIETEGHLYYINAGHPPPLLIRGQEAYLLDATGIALGFLPEYTWKRSHVNFDESNILVIYSDGIVEREDEDGEQFGLERLQKLVITMQESSAKEILDTIFKSVFEFGDRSSWSDDATLVVIKRCLGKGA